MPVRGGGGEPGMGDDKKDTSPVRNPFQWVFRASLLLLGAVIALNLTVAFLCPLLPWIAMGIGLVTIGWLAVTVVRWRRSRW